MLTTSNFTALVTLSTKESKRILRLWTQCLLPSTISSLLYFLIFGHLLAVRIGNISGFHYAQFIAPGLIMMAIINNTYSNVSSSLFLARFQRSIEELLVSPTPNWIVLLGYISGGVVRGLLVGIAVTIVSLLFVTMPFEHPFLMLLVILMISMLFSLMGFINALYAKNFEDIMVVPTFVLTPLTYLGGVFYPLAGLPIIWKYFSYVNPVVYFVNLFRYAALGSADMGIGFSLFAMFFLLIALFLICLHLLNRGVGLRS